MRSRSPSWRPLIRRPFAGGKLCEAVPRRSVLKPARKPPPASPNKGNQSIESNRKTVRSDRDPEGRYPLYIGCSPCAGGGSGGVAACPQSRATRPPAPTSKQRASFIPIPSRGGARNRRDRSSSALSLAAASGLIDAAAFALAAGLGLNRFVTLHWAAGGVTDDLAALARWLKLAGDWIRSCGGRFAYIWIRESGPDKGAHVHILLHLPPELADGFDRRQRGWQTASGAEWKAGVRYSRPIGRNLRHYAIGEIYGQSYEANLAEALDYVLKGAERAAHERLGIRRKEPGGVIVGKRCSVSVNIGPAKRRSARWGVTTGCSLMSER